MNRIPRIFVYSVAACMVLSQAACLKTRAQIKGEREDSGDVSDDGAETQARPKGYELEEIRHEVTRLSGKLDEVDHNQRTVNTSELKEYITRIDTRVADLEKNQLLLMSEVKAIKDAKAVAAKEAATPPVDLMTQANQLLSEKKCDEAAEKFKSVLGKGMKGKDAAEAHYGLGEAEYCQKAYVKAIVQYSKVEESFPKSTRIPASLYRIALSFQHLNKTKESRGFFNEVIDRYPKSPEAKKARAKVKE